MKEYESIIHYDRIGDSDMFNCHEVGQLVRCKDCKYRNGDKDKPYCDRINPYRSFYVGDNDFCSWGEKNG